MSFPRYERYKGSGVEWLGEVPEGWEVLPLKRSFNIVGGSTPKSDQEAYWDGEIVWVTPSDLSKLQSLYISDSQRKITDNGLASCGVSLVPTNSIILSTRAPIGSLAITNSEMCTNQGCKSLVPGDSSDAKFYGYLLSNSSTELNIRGKGTTFLELSGDELGAFKVPSPSLPEQHTIAAFLDRETGKIDELVAEQERLIALLKEKRQATISHSVTKGPNPDAPMKDSGIEWLGTVPVGWEVLKIKHFTSFCGGGTPSRDNLDYWNGDIPWVSPKDMKKECIDGSEESITASGLANSSSTLVPPGRVLIVVRSGILKHTIPVAINDVPVSLNQDMKALIFAEGSCLSRFFLRWVQGLNDLLLLAWAKQGATVESIEHAYLSETVMPLPPIKEQSAIVAFLDSETAKNDALVGEAQQAIGLLKERRSALVSAAVTGKIDVRGWVS